MGEIDILVADDEPHIARALAFILNREGYRVETASDGDEALAIFERSRPRLVFLDLLMPRKNGDEVCRAIKSNPEFRDAYVIILTCKGQESDRQNCLRAGVDDFMTKPFSPQDVLAKVRSILR